MEPMGKLKTCEPFYHSRDSAIGQCASGSRQVYTQQLEKSQVPRTLAGTFWAELREGGNKCRTPCQLAWHSIAGRAE